MSRPRSLEFVRGAHGAGASLRARVRAFERTFTLPATADAERIKASYENGVLTVTLPKVEKAKPRQIQVEVAKA
ncbi:MAG: Hsp20/alpha crystallin family protein [Gemmatimonadales bacterium]